jgi:membrane-associated phospholipid phosphatase
LAWVVERVFVQSLPVIKHGNAMRFIFQWLVGLIATVVAVTVSFQWFDRPIALMVHNNLGQPHFGIFEWLTHIPDPLIPLAVITFILLGLRILVSRTLSDFQAVAFVCSISVIVGETIKDQLKFIFGRTWPETWIGNNPSFIRDGVYGFHFMHGGAAYQSFPSGHMAATCALMSVLWIWYPRLRALWAIAGLAVGAGLVGADFHFLSDVIAGAFVGLSIGWMITAIWKLCVPISVQNAK